MAGTFVVVILAFSCALLQPSEGLKCFGGNGMEDVWSYKNTVTECHPNATTCVVSQTNMSGSITTIKTCALPGALPGGIPGGACNNKTTKQVDQGGQTVTETTDICCCEDDYCNIELDTCKAIHTVPPNVTMVKRTEGRCVRQLPEDECKAGPYPNSYMQWKETEEKSNSPGGCYQSSLTDVSFNPAVGTDCTSWEPCLCKKAILEPTTEAPTQTTVTTEPTTEAPTQTTVTTGGETVLKSSAVIVTTLLVALVMTVAN